jgi:iron complex outermembrane recepter protein
MHLHRNPRLIRSNAGSPAKSVAAAVTLAIVASVLQVSRAEESAAVDEVVVTAQRRAQNILDVPLSVTSYSPEQLEQQGIHGIDDLARLTPSLKFGRTSGVSGNNGSDISLRGIASDVGSATTAIYIDDTPIQIRNIGYFGGNTYPMVFDLERIEVLRGPQGTLFGAGAEGGAVRFITPTPTFSGSSLSAKTEFSSIRNGATNYEAGVAGGTAASDTIALRGSVWYRHDGGYIDRYDPTLANLVAKDINSADNYSARVALGWKATEALTVTPSVYYQKTTSEGRSQYWESASNISTGNFRTGIYNAEPSEDRFTLPALKIELDFGGIQLISNTSYFDRSRSQSLDYATFLSSNRSGNPFGTYGNKDPTNAVARQNFDQQNLIQEVRLVSASPMQKVDWTVGAFYSKADQEAINMSGSGRIPGVISSGFPQYLGRYNLFDDIVSTDKQLAGFGSVDYKPMDLLTLTAGARVSRNEFNFGETRDGPVNGGRRTFDTASQSATSFTPKLGANLKLDANNLLYTSVSKGFRPGGAQSPVDPVFCAADLATLGLTASPREYDSDSLWSYELGSKNRLFDGALLVDVNAYYVKWKNIQQSIRLPRCSFSYIANLGEATGKGADMSFVVRPATGLSLGAAVGYNTTSYDRGITGGNGLVIKQSGDRIGGPKFTGSLYGLVEHRITNAFDGYARVDYTFQGKGIPQNPADFGYDPGLTPLPSTNTLAVRFGGKFGNADLSLFVNNLTNQTAPISRAHDTIATSLYYDQTYTPRTVGVTWQVKY